MLRTFCKVWFAAVLTEYIIRKSIIRHCTNLGTVAILNGSYMFRPLK